MSEIDTTLLPPTSTPLAKVLDRLEERLGELPVDALSKAPDAVRAEYMELLAWELSVDDWDRDWPEVRKRAVLAAAEEVHRLKGTKTGVVAALEAMGYGNAQVIEAREFPRLGGGAPDATGAPLGRGWRLGDPGARIGSRPALTEKSVLPLGKYWKLGKPEHWADYMVSVNSVIAKADADALERRLADVAPVRCRLAGVQIEGVRHGLGDGQWTLGATIPLGGAYGSASGLYAPNLGGAYTVGPYTPVMAGKFAGGAVSWGGFAERLSFSRASVATYVDQDGIIQSAPADDMRVDWSSGTGRQLIEAGKTRLNKYPVATIGPWQNANAVLSAATVDAFGAFPGVLVQSAGADWHRLGPPQMTFVSGQTYAIKTHYAEPLTGSSGMCRITAWADNGALSVSVSGAVGNLGATAQTGATVLAVRNSIVGTVGGYTIHECEIVVTVTHADILATFQVGPNSAVAGEGVIVLGQMVTTGAGADDTIGSWILDNPAGTANRAADLCNVDLTGLGLQDGYTLLVGGVAQGVTGASNRVAQLDDGNAANRQLLLYHKAIDQFRGEVLTGDVFQASANFGGVLGADFRMAAAIGPDHAQWAFDGAAANIGDPSVSFVTPDTLHLGNGGAGEVPARLEIDEFRLFRGPLSQQYLELMTAPGA